MVDINYHFYDHFPIGKLNTIFAKTAGLENAYELDLVPISKLINESKSILEIGAGEGRIIQGLLNKNYSGAIFALERSKTFLQHLKTKYSSNSNITILEKDISCDDLPIADLGLFLWSGILEFSEKEQKNLVGKIARCCKKLVIDTPALNAANNATESFGQNLVLKTDFGEIQGRIPLESEMKKWAKHFERKVEVINYKTTNGRERILYIIF